MGSGFQAPQTLRTAILFSVCSSMSESEKKWLREAGQKHTKVHLGAGAIAQLIKCLSCKHKGLGLILEPTRHILKIPVVGRQRQEILGALKSASGAYLSSSNERPCLKRNSKWHLRNNSQGYLPTSICAQAHMLLHTHAPACTCTCTCTHLHLQAYVHTCSFTYMHLHTHEPAHTCTCTHMHLHIHAPAHTLL